MARLGNACSIHLSYGGTLKAILMVMLNSSLQATYPDTMQERLVELPPQSAHGQPSFKEVGQCLYRYSNTGTYYALVKRGGKQFRKSLKDLRPPTR
jgi:hypothetical protein